jgi:transcriptional regulator with XRE-family HTH domain
MARTIQKPTSSANGSAAHDFQQRVRDLRESGLTNKQIADVVGVSARQVSNWSNGSSQPVGGSAESLLELHYVVGYLADVYSPRGIAIWVLDRNRQLQDRKPIDVMAGGDFESVLDVAIGLAEGFPA